MKNPRAWKKKKDLCGNVQMDGQIRPGAQGRGFRAEGNLAAGQFPGLVAAFGGGGWRAQDKKKKKKKNGALGPGHQKGGHFFRRGGTGLFTKGGAENF